LQVYREGDRGVTDLIGLPIKLARTIDGPCGACGETTVIIGSSAGPHMASLRCACCDRHRGWLPKPVAAFLTDLVGRFGRPTDPITVRNSELAATLGAHAAEASTAP
jgi:hypothetical protein